MSTLSDNELMAIRVSADVASGLSLCGSVFIIACYFRYAHLRRLSFKLVAILAVLDICNQAFDFMSPSVAELDSMEAGGPTTPLCWAQALGNSEFELASVLQTGAIAWTLYALVWSGWRVAEIEAALPRMVGVVLAVPALLTVLPFMWGPYVFGPAGAHCWLRKEYIYFGFVTFYIPLWLTMAWNAFVHVRTRLRLQRLVASRGLDPATLSRLELILARLQWYPFILIIVWAPASVNRIYEAIAGPAGADVFVLSFLQRVCSSSQGALNALAYGLSRGVREAVHADLHACAPSCVAAPVAPAAELVAAQAEGGSSGSARGVGSGSGSKRGGLAAQGAVQGVDARSMVPVGGGASGAGVEAGAAAGAPGSSSLATAEAAAVASAPAAPTEAPIEDDDLSIAVPPSSNSAAWP